MLTHSVSDVQLVSPNPVHVSPTCFSVDSEMIKSKSNHAQNVLAKYEKSKTEMTASVEGNKLKQIRG